MTSPKRLAIRANPNWRTPPELYRRLDEEFHFDFDPCPYPRPAGFDGLNCFWKNSNFVNPPYGAKNIPKWVKKGVLEAKLGKLSVFLLPASTDDRWFHEWVLPFAREIRFIRGRLKFLDPEHGGNRQGAIFASMIVVFHPKVIGKPALVVSGYASKHFSEFRSALYRVSVPGYSPEQAEDNRKVLLSIAG